MLKIGVFGASGRIGRLIIDEIVNSKDLQIGAIFVRKELDFSLPEGSFVTNDILEFIECCDVIIDFTSPEASKILFQELIKNPKPCVVGTTGLSEDDFALIKQASLKAPILYASNMSLGIALLNKIISNVAKTLRDADIEISEIHHHHKVDAPSGTALSLAKSCADSRGVKLEDVMVTNRAQAGKRKKDEISVVSLRGGDVAGRHVVGFYMDGEYLEFMHNATSRTTFAKGAITCAKWLHDKNPGLYEIYDVFDSRI